MTKEIFKLSQLLNIRFHSILRSCLQQEEFEDTKGAIRICISKTTQWPKEKVQKDKQRSTKYTYKTKALTQEKQTKQKEVNSGL
jgi:hypothetical protein